MPLDRAGRRQLRAALAASAPFTQRTDVGPRAVDAGACDRCEDRPRLVPTCGPAAWRALCRDCVLDVGLDAWCDGHAADGRERLDWVADLPPWWADATVLWWVATGEVQGPPDLLDPGLPGPVRAALPPG